MVMGDRHVRVKDETIGGANCESHIQHDQDDRESRKTALHGVSVASTCRTKAIDSELSHTRGPTARPTMWPSCPITSVVGSPRTESLRESSWSSSNATGRRISS